ncbi:MAG: hypothetical protein ACFCUM_00720, partial [Bacteroidales bacterium]
MMPSGSFSCPEKNNHNFIRVPGRATYFSRQRSSIVSAAGLSGKPLPGPVVEAVEYINGNVYIIHDLEIEHPHANEIG